MAWVVLILSGMFEAVWAVALGKSDGFSRTGPTIVFFFGMIVSMAGLAYAMKTLPTGTSYAIWVSVGASLTVIYSILFDGESASPLKILFLMGMIGCVAGLKAVD